MVECESEQPRRLLALALLAEHRAGAAEREQLERDRRRVVCLLERRAEGPLRLVDAAERQRTKEELLRDVWGFRSQGRTRTLDSRASRLRRRLTRPGSTPYVHNVWGVSYCLLGD